MGWGGPWRYRDVFIDGCAINRFAARNLDPIRALQGSEFEVALTADLAAEYRRALTHRLVEPHIKHLLAIVLERGVTRDIPVSPAGVDATLAALSATDFVITEDTRGVWARARGNPGLMVWADLDTALRDGATLVEVLRARAQGDHGM